MGQKNAPVLHFRLYILIDIPVGCLLVYNIWFLAAHRSLDHCSSKLPSACREGYLHQWGRYPYAPTLEKLTKLLSGNFTFFNKSIFRQF